MIEVQCKALIFNVALWNEQRNRDLEMELDGRAFK